MLAEAQRRAPELPRVRADLAALPFRARSLDGAWAVNCYCHVPLAQLPMAFADLHLALRAGAPVELTLPRIEFFDAEPAESARGECERRDDRKDTEVGPGRLFIGLTLARSRALLLGAGFESLRFGRLKDTFWLTVKARRARTLPDFVAPELGLLVCGLNPSLYSADVGVPFARPGNRFWPAARAAGIIEVERDPRAALSRGVGFTDVVKRASAGAAEIEPREYRAGMKRLEALVRSLRPAAICFVGLDAWRTAVDRRAQPGRLPQGFAGRPAYLMPSTSGRNARVPVADLAAHLRAATTLSRRERALS
jgi:TDG/mug DNA glycosylase family protein